MNFDPKLLTFQIHIRSSSASSHVERYKKHQPKEEVGYIKQILLFEGLETYFFLTLTIIRSQETLSPTQMRRGLRTIPKYPLLIINEKYNCHKAQKSMCGKTQYIWPQSALYAPDVHWKSLSCFCMINHCQGEEKNLKFVLSTHFSSCKQTR